MRIQPMREYLRDFRLGVRHRDLSPERARTLRTEGRSLQMPDLFASPEGGVAELTSKEVLEEVNRIARSVKSEKLEKKQTKVLIFFTCIDLKKCPYGNQVTFLKSHY